MRSRLRLVWQPGLHLSLLTVIAYLVWLMAAPPSLPRSVAGLLGGLAARSAAAMALLTAAGRLGSPAPQQAWRTFGVGATLWAVGAGVAMTMRLASAGRLPLPSLADWMVLAGSLAALTGIALYRQRMPERFSRVREVLDTAILVLAVAALAWLIFIRSALGVGLGGAIPVVWAALSPAIDLVLVGLLVRLLLRSEHDQEATVFVRLALGALILTASDLGDGYRRLLGDSSTGGLIEAGWMAAGLLMAFAAQRLGIQRAAKRERRPALLRFGTRIEALMPIGLTYAVVGTLIIDWSLSKRVDWFMVAAAAALCLLLMARQGVIIGQVEMRQYAALVNSSADLSFICDEAGKILLSNPALHQGVGWREASLGEARLGDVLVGHQSTEAILGEGLKGGWSGEVALRRHGPEGPLFPAYLSLRPIQDERRSEPLLAGTAHDLTLVKRRESDLERALAEVATARKDLEQLNTALEQKVEARTQQLEATVADLARLNQELQELDRLKSEFVSLVSHELRAPLTNIRSGIEFILERQLTLGSSTETSLRLVQQESERLTALVEMILDLSALEAGRFPLEFRPISLAEVAQEVVAQFPNLGRLRAEFPPDLPRIRADEGGLKSILYHLLDNAIKYAPEGELQLKAAVANGSIQVSLSDSGPGIPPEERERIFDMFHRLDSRDEREVYGHGLGLPMARRLAEAMGGGIRVERGQNAGARFVFWLPQADV